MMSSILTNSGSMDTSTLSRGELIFIPTTPQDSSTRGTAAAGTAGTAGTAAVAIETKGSNLETPPLLQVNNDPSVRNIGTGRSKTEQVILECFYKATEIILQSRGYFPSHDDRRVLNSLENRPPRNRRARFNLDVEEIEILRRRMMHWKTNPHLPLTLDIYWDTRGGDQVEGEETLLGQDSNVILLERWDIRYSTASDHHDADNIIAQLRFVVKKIGVFLRALYSFVKLLPSFQLMQRAQGTPSSSCMRYVIYTHTAEGCILASSNLKVPREGQFDPDSGISRYCFVPIETPFGLLEIKVLYRKECAFSIQESMGQGLMDKCIIQDYVPTLAGTPQRGAVVDNRCIPHSLPASWQREEARHSSESNRFTSSVPLDIPSHLEPTLKSLSTHPTSRSIPIHERNVLGVGSVPMDIPTKKPLGDSKDFKSNPVTAHKQGIAASPSTHKSTNKSAYSFGDEERYRMKEKTPTSHTGWISPVPAPYGYLNSRGESPRNQIPSDENDVVACVEMPPPPPPPPPPRHPNSFGSKLDSVMSSPHHQPSSVTPSTNFHKKFSLSSSPPSFSSDIGWPEAIVGQDKPSPQMTPPFSFSSSLNSPSPFSLIMPSFGSSPPFQGNSPLLLSTSPLSIFGKTYGGGLVDQRSASSSSSSASLNNNLESDVRKESSSPLFLQDRKASVGKHESFRSSPNSFMMWGLERASHASKRMNVGDALVASSGTSEVFSLGGGEEVVVEVEEEEEVEEVEDELTSEALPFALSDSTTRLTKIASKPNSSMIKSQSLTAFVEQLKNAPPLHSFSERGVVLTTDETTACSSSSSSTQPYRSMASMDRDLENFRRLRDELSAIAR